jgi:hypothetical protein
LIATTSKKLFSRANSKAIALLVTTYTLLLGVFYAPYLLGHSCFYYTDTTFFLEPHAKFLSTALKQGQIPLWNPFNYCGMPQIAITFPSLFYPPDWLLVILPFSQGLAVSMIFHLTLAAAGFYLLAKSFRYKSAEAFVGTLVFSLSGFMFCLSSNISLVAGLAWLPISMWALRELEIAKNRDSFWSLIRASICTLMLLLSGRPEVIGPALLGLVLYGIVSAMRRGRTGGKLIDEASTNQLRALFLGIAFSLPALLPVAEWLSMSRRSTGLKGGEIFLYSAHWYDLLSMFFGPSLGDLRLYDAPFRPLVSFANLPAYISCAFVGPVTLTLSVWGMLDKTWRWRWLVSILFVLILAASLGNYTSLVPDIVQMVPLLGFVRFPIKLLGFSILLLGLMSAQGMSSFTDRRAALRGSCLFWFAVLVAGISAQVLSANHQLCLQFATLDKPIALMLQAQFLIGKSLSVAAGWGLGATLLAKLVMDKKVSTAIGTTLLLLALLGTLLTNAFNFERKGASSSFWELPSFGANAIKTFQTEGNVDSSTRIFTVAFERFTIPPAFLTQNRANATINEFQYHRQILRQNNNIDFSISDCFGFEGTSRGDYYYTGLHSYLESSQSTRPEISPSSDLPLAKFCAITSTNYLITQKYRKIGKRVPVSLLNDRLFHLLLEDESMNIRIYRVLSSLPKLYITHNWRWTNSHNTILDSIVSPTSSSVDPFTSTVLEQVEGKKALVCATKTDLREPTDELRVLTTECNQTGVKVKIDHDGYLVLSDQFYPGWHAYIDSKPTTIYAANGFTRAVQIPPGEHLVEFKYEPESFTLGCILAALAGLLACYLFVIEKKGD